MTRRKIKIKVDNKEYEVYKLDGHGQCFCKMCEKYGRYGLHWPSFCYQLDDEVLCYDCLVEKLREIEFKQRVDCGNNAIVED